MTAALILLRTPARCVVRAAAESGAARPGILHRGADGSGFCHRRPGPLSQEGLSQTVVAAVKYT